MEVQGGAGGHGRALSITFLLQSGLRAESGVPGVPSAAYRHPDARGAASCRPARVKLRFAGDRGDTIRVQLPVAVALAALNELDRVAMPVCDPSGASIRSAAVAGKRETL
jgi:hypothetical protein